MELPVSTKIYVEKCKYSENYSKLQFESGAQLPNFHWSHTFCTSVFLKVCARNPKKHSATIPRIKSTCKGYRCVGLHTTFYYKIAEPKMCYTLWLLFPSWNTLLPTKKKKKRVAVDYIIKQAHLAYIASILLLCFFFPLILINHCKLI